MPRSLPTGEDLTRSGYVGYNVDVTGKSKPGPAENKAAAPVEEEKDDLESLTVPELRELAAERDIEGRSGMNKAQLLKALK